MPKEKLDLLQVPAGGAAKLRAGPAQIVRTQTQHNLETIYFIKFVFSYRIRCFVAWGQTFMDMQVRKTRRTELGLIYESDHFLRLLPHYGSANTTHGTTARVVLR